MWDDAWFVGIVGGIVSGVIVYFITDFLFKKLTKKDYFEKANKVNRGIVELLIMLISEGKIPSPKTINSLLNSLSRNYGVKRKDVNSFDETLEDLIKEIFDTKFIPNDKKIGIAEELAIIIEEYEKTEEFIFEEKHYLNSNLNNNLTFTIPIGITLSFIMPFLTGAILLKSNTSIQIEQENILQIMLITTATLTLVVSILSFIFGKKRSKSKMYTEFDDFSINSLQINNNESMKLKKKDQ